MMKLKAWYKLPIVILFSIYLCVNKGWGYIEVEVSDMNYTPMPILLFNILSDKKSSNIANILQKEIGKDLQNSGVFFVYHNDLPKEINNEVSLEDTSVILSSYMDFNALIIAKVSYENNCYIINYVVWDTYNNKALLAKGFKLINPTADDIIYLAHYISNNIYQVFVGEEGYFNSKVAFVYNKKIYIMDYDGKNIELLVDTGLDVYTPVFSFDNKYIAYIAINKGVSEIYIYDLQHKLNYKLGNFNSLVLAPRFSRDGKYMLFAVANKGSTNIFKLNIGTKEIQQLTFSDSINIPGSFSPNGDQIVFISDRRGNPQIYTMKSDGSSVKKISNLEGAYYTPKWSPRGDLIAFTKIVKGGNFQIGVITPKGSKERIVAEDYFAEGPSWSSNGRNLIYQYVYDSYSRKYGFCIVGLSNGFKILLQPFDHVKDPCMSTNFINNNILKVEYDLRFSKNIINN